jgi:hypothetical protein
MKWFKCDNVDTMNTCNKVSTNTGNKVCGMCKKPGEFYSDFFEGQYCKVHHKTITTAHKLKCLTKKCNNLVNQGVFLNKSLGDKTDNSNNESIKYGYDFGWCDEHFDKEYSEYLTKKTKKISQNSNKISHLTLGGSMYKKLDEMPELLRVDEVFVENQPTHINPVMKTVSAMLFSYFIMRGIHEKVKNGSTISNISFCSPASKIKVGGKDANDKVDNATSDKVYKVTKKLGIKFCKALISDNPEYLAMIESYKKQDDMADAFLQGFIKVFGTTLPKHYEDRIKGVDLDTIDVLWISIVMKMK